MGSRTYGLKDCIYVCLSLVTVIAHFLLSIVLMLLLPYLC